MKDKYDEEIEHIVKCHECLSRNLITDYTKGELFCGDCGLVLADEMLEESHHGKERAGDFDAKRTHEATKSSYTLGSMVGNKLSDGSLDRSRLGRRLRHWDRRTQISDKQKNELRGIVAVKMLGANIGVSENVKELCSAMYRQIYKESWIRGCSLDVRAAAILYWICLEHGINRKIREIIEHNGAHPRQTMRLVRRLASHYKKPWLLSERNFESDIQKYCNAMQMDNETISQTIKLAIPIEQMGEAKFISMNTGYVAAIIYLGILCGNGSCRTQSEISSACGITEVTLRTNFKNICKGMGLDRQLVKEGYYTVEDIVTGAYRNE